MRAVAAEGTTDESARALGLYIGCVALVMWLAATLSAPSWSDLTGLGYAVEALGLLLTALGILETWRAHRPGERLLDSWWRRGERARLWLRVHVLRRSPRFHALASSDTLNVAVRAHAGGVVTTNEALFDPHDVEGSLLWLHDSVAALRESVREFAEQHAKADSATAERISQVEDRLSAQSTEVEALEHKVTTEGLRGELVGLLLVAAGLGLQMAASVGAALT